MNRIEAYASKWIFFNGSFSFQVTFFQSRIHDMSSSWSFLPIQWFSFLLVAAICIKIWFFKNYSRTRVNVVPEDPSSTCVRFDHPLTNCSESVSRRYDSNYSPVCTSCHTIIDSEFRRYDICNVDYCFSCANKIAVPIASPVIPREAEIVTDLTEDATPVCNEHIYRDVSCVHLVNQGQTEYSQGFQCDECLESFSTFAKLYKCVECHLDFCDGCKNQRIGVLV